MGIQIKFRRNYFILAVVLFFIEILIALFMHDKIVRPYIGDFLVVILIYCFIRSFIDMAVLKTCISVLIFSYLIEILQHFDIVTKLGLQHSTRAKTVMGTSFEWTDLVAYTLGIAVVLWVEKVMAAK